MKKYVLSAILIVVMVVTMISPAFASSVEVQECNDVQKEIDQTINRVIDYLNEQQALSLECLEEKNFEIPIDEEHEVTVKIKNEQIQKERDFGYSNFYDFVEGGSYIYTLTITNFYLFSGEIEYKVYYTVGSIFSEKMQTYKLKATNVVVTATAPAGFSVKEAKGAITVEGNGLHNAIQTEGHATFESILLPDVTINIDVDIVSMPNRVIHNQYEWK